MRLRYQIRDVLLEKSAPRCDETGWLKQNAIPHTDARSVAAVTCCQQSMSGKVHLHVLPKEHDGSIWAAFNGTGKMVDVGAEADAGRAGTGGVRLASGGSGRSADQPGFGPKGATAGPSPSRHVLP